MMTPKDIEAVHDLIKALDELSERSGHSYTLKVGYLSGTGYEILRPGMEAGITSKSNTMYVGYGIVQEPYPAYLNNPGLPMGQVVPATAAAIVFHTRAIRLLLASPPPDQDRKED